MVRQLRQMMGGGLRPSDPRRFLIEAMVGAMTADGRIEDQELEVLRHRLDEHDLFAGLPHQAADMLIETGSDSVRFAGGGARRVGAIARGLPSRAHRLAAYAMACEVCAADEIGPEEEAYLEALRRGLSVGPQQARDLLAAARSGKAMRALETEVERIHEQVPLLVDCLNLYLEAQEDAPADRGAWLRAVLMSLEDLHERPDDIEREIERVLARNERHKPDPADGIRRVAAEMTAKGDRHWTTVYLFLVERSRGNGDFRGLPFYPELQAAFELGDGDLHRAWQDATQLPRVELP